MRLKINGKFREFELQASPGGELSLALLLKILEIKTETVALEVNERVIERENWSSYHLHPEDSVEVMKFVGGG